MLGECSWVANVQPPTARWRRAADGGGAARWSRLPVERRPRLLSVTSTRSRGHPHDAVPRRPVWTALVAGAHPVSRGGRRLASGRAVSSSPSIFDPTDAESVVFQVGEGEEAAGDGKVGGGDADAQGEGERRAVGRYGTSAGEHGLQQGLDVEEDLARQTCHRRQREYDRGAATGQVTPPSAVTRPMAGASTATGCATVGRGLEVGSADDRGRERDDREQRGGVTHPRPRL